MGARVQRHRNRKPWRLPRTARHRREFPLPVAASSARLFSCARPGPCRFPVSVCQRPSKPCARLVSEPNAWLGVLVRFQHKRNSLVQLLWVKHLAAFETKRLRTRETKGLVRPRGGIASSPRRAMSAGPNFVQIQSLRRRFTDMSCHICSNCVFAPNFPSPPASVSSEVVYSFTPS